MSGARPRLNKKFLTFSIVAGSSRQATQSCNRVLHEPNLSQEVNEKESFMRNRSGHTWVRRLVRVFPSYKWFNHVEASGKRCRKVLAFRCVLPKARALASAAVVIANEDKSGIFSKSIVIQIALVSKLFTAEKMWQDYLRKHSDGYFRHYLRQFDLGNYAFTVDRES